MTAAHRRTPSSSTSPPSSPSSSPSSAPSSVSTSSTSTTTNTSSCTSATTSTTPITNSNLPLIVKIGDKWVNLDIWKRTHPGGSEALERFRGQDATEAFESLHSKEAVQMLEKMKNVESNVNYQKIIENYSKPNDVTLAFRKFRAQLELEGWFKRNWLWDASLIFILISMMVVGTIVSYSHPLIAIVLIGTAMQQAGWIGHDYVHGRGKASEILGNLIGGLFNAFSGRWWSAKHNKHHVHTNQFGVDDDIQNDPIIHLWIPQPEKDHPLRPYQHLYYHFAYSFLYFSWRIQSFQHSWSQFNKFELFLQLINYIYLLCLPLHVSLGSIFLGGFLVAEIVTATHQSEEILDGLSYSFVEDQFRTTRDVDIDNYFFNFLWGGMQYQLEHHLFPTMPKYRYRALRERVKEFAKNNGIEYRSSSATEIFKMNYQTLKRFSVTKG